MFAFHSILQVLVDLAGPAKTAFQADAALQEYRTPLPDSAGNVYSTHNVLRARRVDMMLHGVTTGNASLRKVRFWTWAGFTHACFQPANDLPYHMVFVF